MSIKRLDLVEFICRKNPQQDNKIRKLDELGTTHKKYLKNMRI